MIPRVLSRTVAGTTKWLQLLTLSYEDQTGKKRAWDMVHRATTPLPALRDASSLKAGSIRPDAVAIVALLKGNTLSTEPEIVLVRQFRPPVDAYTIEFPAGLIDPKETPGEAALRELKEETGYVGSVKESSVASCLSPGLTSETVSVVVVNVDLTLEENQKPIAQPDEGEYVQRIVVPISRLSDELASREKDGDVVFGAVRTFALGYQLQSKL
eukprot:TRINITY_DN27077_c0_g1_i1.p1 TRINITY_DN27077_c0_g1~~TRINITY_DN27077_c0_g1_i1.p1  ORF type:complete len:213 (+),score=35.14 TRINITY_DN27077_c0_g1_i1:161-799(+)